MQMQRLKKKTRSAELQQNPHQQRLHHHNPQRCRNMVETGPGGITNGIANGNVFMQMQRFKKNPRSSELQQKSSLHVEKNIALINTSTTTLTSSACAAPRKDPAPCGEARHLTVQRSNGPTVRRTVTRLGIEGNRGSHPRTVVGACSPPAANYEIHMIHMTQSHTDTIRSSI